jgi:hypothetical protein
MGQILTALINLRTNQRIMLRPAQKTAQVSDLSAPRSDTDRVLFSKANFSLKPTGRQQDINGQRCEEFTFATAMDLGQLGGLSPQLPKEFIEMTKGITLTTKGTVWIARTAPGAAEYRAYHKAATPANLAAPSASGLPSSPGQTIKLLSVGQDIGIPYLIQLETAYEGTGPVVEMLKPMGAMKITSKVTDVSTAPISDEVFKVPEDYTIQK